MVNYERWLLWWKGGIFPTKKRIAVTLLFLSVFVMLGYIEQEGYVMGGKVSFFPLYILIALADVVCMVIWYKRDEEKRKMLKKTKS